MLECNKRQLLESSDEGEAMCCLNEFMANIGNKDHVAGKSYDENMVCLCNIVCYSGTYHILDIILKCLY